MAEAKTSGGKKAANIIIKKIKKSGHGGHGGAWKVAYADFVTAMMCFFLVMWLMASDDETKAAIAEYFNHPEMPWSLNSNPDSLDPSKGENILKGQNGYTPEELIKRPVPPNTPALTGPIQEHENLAALIQDLLDQKAYQFDIQLDTLRFSIPESLLFERDSVNLKPGSHTSLEKLGKLFKSYMGQIQIAVHSDPVQLHPGGFQNPYEFTLARAVSVMNYLIERQWAEEERITPQGIAGKQPLIGNTSAPPEERSKNRRVEFILSRSPHL